MIKFWEAMAGKLADRWMSAAGSALVFWAGGILAVLFDLSRSGGLKDPIAWLGSRPVVIQVGLVVAALLIVTASGLVVRQLNGFTLAVVQGRWRWFGLSRVARRLSTCAAAKTERRHKCWEVLAGKGLEKLSSDERQHYVRLDEWLRHRPLSGVDALPTPLGNMVQAGDMRLMNKYGLAPAVMWPRLLLVLPQHVREELASARAGVDAAVSAIVWGTAFVVFAWWTVWALAVAAAVVCSTIAIWLPHRLATMVEVTESVFDLYRFDVYEQLRVPVPEGTATEKSRGEELTTYLYRGLAVPSVKFTTSAEGNEG